MVKNELEIRDVRNNGRIFSAINELEVIGEGSYARVFLYNDESTKQNVVVKRAKEELTIQELERFKRECEQMATFSSPYLVEVYQYNDESNSYTMEYMDYTLDQYIRDNNGILSFEERKAIASQFLQGMKYIQEQGLLHGDINPKNVLLKKEEDGIRVKIADFGLVKFPDTTIIEDNNEYKGYFTDPDLAEVGFDQYGTIHEIYAVGKVVYYIMTGKYALGNMREGKLKEFVKRGLHPDLRQRFTSIDDMIDYFNGVSGY